MKQISKKNIDKYNLLLTDKKNILKIIFISVLTVILMLSFQVSQKKKLNVSLKILPITFEKLQQYKYLNYFVKKNINLKEVVLLNEINESYLLDLFITELEEGSLLYELIDEYKLIERSNYNNIDDYEFAINSIISSIEFKPITTLDTQNPFKSLNNLNEASKIENRIEYWNLEFEIDYENKLIWNKILYSIEKKINNKIYLHLKKDYELTYFILEQDFSTEIETIKKQIQNRYLESLEENKKYENEVKFKLEDTDVLIKNSYRDYMKDVSSKLAFLREQAAIAKELKIKNKILEANVFDYENNFMITNSNEQPFYTRGYLAIEKEIELIESRNDVSLFVKGLKGLEKQKRTLLQDKTVSRVEINKKYSDKVIKLNNLLRETKAKNINERFKQIANTVLLNNDDEFKAITSFKNKAVYESISANMKILLILSSIIGALLGVIYIVISSIFKR